MNQRNFNKTFCLILLPFISILLAAEPIKYLRPRDLRRNIPARSMNSSRNNRYLPVNFIENKGQAGKEILFYAYMKESVLEVKKDGLYLIPKDFSSKIDGKNVFKDITLLSFIGENHNYSIKGHKQLGTKYNFYPDPQGKNKYENITAYEYVIYHNVYHHIDLKIYINEDRIEYDWILHPGSKISDIKFRPGDFKDVVINDKGDLCYNAAPGEIIHKKPASYQLIKDARTAIDSEFVKISSDGFGFKTDKYNHEYPLFIDPLVLVSASYLGGTDWELPDAQSVDNMGNLYMVGTTCSFDFPLVNSLEEPQENPNGYLVIWVAKFDKDFKTPVYISIFGQKWNLDPIDCEVDSNGNLYVITDLQHWDPICDSYGRCIDGYNSFWNIHGNWSTFIFALDPAGLLLFISLTGGTDDEYTADIEIDKDNNIYITGVTYSPDFPVKNAYQSNFTGIGDLYLVKYTPFCRDIIYSTFYGDAHYNVAYGLALDTSGAVYCIDWWVSAGIEETMWGVVKFNPEGIAEYAYWYAPSNFWRDEEINYTEDIAVDDQNRAYIVGLLPGKYVTAKYQDWDAFFYILNPQGTSFEYSTVFAGNNTDYAHEIKIDKSGDIYISGVTRSTDFPLIHSLKDKLEGLSDTFIMKIDHTTKEIVFSSLFGGDGSDFGTYGVDYFTNMNIGEDGTIYLSGFTSSSNLPVKNAYQYWMTPLVDEWAGDIYFLRLKWNDGLAAVIGSERMAGLAPASIKFNSSDSESVSGEITDWNWDFGDNSTGNGKEITHEFAQSGEYAVTLTVADNLGKTSTDKTSVFVLDHANISSEVTFEKNGVKANGKEEAYGSLYIKDTRDGSLIHFPMQPSISIDNGNSGNETLSSIFHRTYGNYEFQFLSGKPGKGTINVKVDGYLLGQAEIQYLWPQRPINLSGKVTVNRSLTRGSVNRVELQWNANPDQPYQIRKYRVFRSYNDNNWELLTELPYHVREYIDNSVPSPKNLKYAVSSIDIDGDESEKAIRIIEY